MSLITKVVLYYFHKSNHTEVYTMNMRQVQSFIILYQTMNLAEAAKQLHTSIEELTDTIHALEREVGLPLFLLTDSHLKKTSYGNLFYMEAVKLWEDYGHMITVLHEAKVSHQYSSDSMEQK